MCAGGSGVLSQNRRNRRGGDPRPGNRAGAAASLLPGAEARGCNLCKAMLYCSAGIRTMHNRRVNVMMTRENRKQQIKAVVIGAGEVMTTREVATAIGLKPTMYVRGILDELVDDGILAASIYELPNKLKVWGFFDARLLG